MEQNERKITLITNDGSQIEIDSKSAEKSSLLKRLMKDFNDDKIPLNNSEVSGNHCRLVSEYLTHYKTTKLKDIKEIWKPIRHHEMSKLTHKDQWAADFADRFTEEKALELCTFANVASFFEIKPLEDLLVVKIGTFLLKYRDDIEKCQKMFNIVNDMTPDQIQEIEDKEAAMDPMDKLVRDSLGVYHWYDKRHNKERNEGEDSSDSDQGNDSDRSSDEGELTDEDDEKQEGNN